MSCVAPSVASDSHLSIGATRQPERTSVPGISVSADNEWSTLRSAIVGRAENSCFPHEPAHMNQATMPVGHQSRFKPRSPFPHDIVRCAGKQLDNLAAVLEDEGVRIYRPDLVDWLEVGGYTGAMPRDALLVVGNTIIESCFAWQQSRSQEVALAYDSILRALDTCGVRIVRAPPTPFPDTLYDLHGDSEGAVSPPSWAINNSRPAFDAADFMRFGQTILGQLSHVTNMKGVQYIERNIPPGYRVELLEITDSHAMHVDATILPLREGFLIFNPFRTTETALRKHSVLNDWELYAYPFATDVEKVPGTENGGHSIPRFMTSPWLVLNLLVLGNNKVIVEDEDEDFAQWLELKGMRVTKVPFRYVHAIGGSFHCASLDLIRQ